MNIQNKRNNSSLRMLAYLLIPLLTGMAVMAAIVFVVREMSCTQMSCPYISTILTLSVIMFLIFIISPAIVFAYILRARERENEIRVINEALLKYAPLTMSVWNKDLKLVMASEQTVEMFGLSASEEYITRFKDISPEYQPCGTPSDEKCHYVVAKAFEEGRYTFEWMHQTLDGELLPTEVTLVRYSNGGVPYVAGFAKDLRPGIEARERELDKITNQRLQTMIEAIPLGCCVTDENLNVLDCNNAIVALFGLKDKQEYISRFRELSPEYQPCGGRTQEMYERILDKTREYGKTKFEWMHRTLDGMPLPVEVNLVRTVIDGKNVIIGYLRDLRDFYEFQKYEREANDRMNLMINTIPLVVTHWAQDHSLLACNQFAMDFYGLDSLEEGYPKVRERVLVGTDWFERLDEIFEKGALSYIYEDAESNIWQMEGVRTTYNGENVVVTYGKNITQVRELEAEQKRREIAEESNRAKTMFIANMSHEIRTPMNSILGYSELALESAAGVTREYLDKITTNSKWLLDIINDVLDISKIESGLVEFEEIPFNIRSLAERCQSLIMPSATDKNIKLSFNVDSSILKGIRLIGDPTKISQVCTNILSNAIKFTDNGGAVIVTIGVKKLDEERCELNFECKDTGIGMTEEQVSKIFEPFMQADSSTTRKYCGTGLGLTIAKRLVTAMGGELCVESFPGLGSKFSFTIVLPSIMVEKTMEGGKHRSGEILYRPIFESMEVLVVDDNDMNLGVACEHLRRVGLTPVVATNGREAISKVQQKIDKGDIPYALILMDIHMAVMDGKEAASIIAGLNVGTPIVAMTAETMVPLEDAPYADYGMMGYLSKPFTSQQLWHCLLKYLQPVNRDDNKYCISNDIAIDKELLMQLKDLFVKNNQDTFTDIDRNISKGNLKEAHRLAHTLKSSSLLIGKTRLGSIAKEAEGFLHAKTEPPDALLKELGDELRQVLDELQSEIANL